MNLGTTQVDVRAVHAELMTEQGNRSVAFGRHKTCLEKMLGFPVKPRSVGNGNLSAGISSLCSLSCYRVTGGVGQDLKKGRWLSCGVIDAAPAQPTREGDAPQHPASFSCCLSWCHFIFPVWRKWEDQ